MEAVVKPLEYIFLTLYLVVFVISIIRFPLYKDSPLKYFPLILLFTVITEFLGGYIRDIIGTSNLIIFNIYYFFYFTLFHYVFLKVIEEEHFKKYIKVGIVFFWLFYLRDLIVVDIFNYSFIASYIVGAGVLIFCIILYYISVLQSSLVLVIKNDLLFWVSVGLFLFYIGYLPIKIMRTLFFDLTNFYLILLIIQFSLIIVMYLFFLIGFIWMKKR